MMILHLGIFRQKSLASSHVKEGSTDRALSYLTFEVVFVFFGVEIGFCLSTSHLPSLTAKLLLCFK